MNESARKNKKISYFLVLLIILMITSFSVQRQKARKKTVYLPNANNLPFYIQYNGKHTDWFVLKWPTIWSQQILLCYTCTEARRERNSLTSVRQSIDVHLTLISSYSGLNDHVLGVSLVRLDSSLLTFIYTSIYLSQFDDIFRYYFLI